jgi:hypothetical protein
MMLPTECETCTGVSRGGRIRVTDTSSAELLSYARISREFWLQRRREWLDNGYTADADALKPKLKELKHVIDELVRTRREMGWPENSMPSEHDIP